MLTLTIIETVHLLHCYLLFWQLWASAEQQNCSTSWYILVLWYQKSGTGAIKKMVPQC